MGTLAPDRRSLLLVAMFPSLAAGLLNQFWSEAAYRKGVTWFVLADIAQWILIPLLVWLLVLQPAAIRAKDIGLHFSPFAQRPAESIGLFIFVALILWVAYEPVKNIAYRFLWRYASTFGYGNTVPSSFPWRLIVVTYFSATAAVVEEVVFRGLPWLYFRLLMPARRNYFWYIVVTSALFAATHSEQGPHGVIATFSFGLVAAMLYARLQNLWPLVFGHFLGDFIGFWPK